MKRLFLSSLYVNLFVRFINLWTGILGARLLGPFGRGELAAANRWTSLFVLLFTLGIPGAAIFYGKQSRERQAEFVGAFLFLGTCVGLAGFALGEAMIPHLFVKQPKVLIHLARVAMISIPFGVLSDGLVGNLLTLNLFGTVLRIRVVGEIGTLLLILVLIVVGKYTVGAFIVTNVVWSIVLFIVTLILVIRAIRPSIQGLLLNAKMLFLKGLHIYSASLVNMFGANIDQLIISLFLNPYTLGLYTVSGTIGGLLPSVVSSALGVYLWPKLMDLPLEHRMDKVERIHGVLFYGTLVATATVSLVIPFLLPMVYGSQFRTAVRMTELMLISAPPSIGYLVLTNYLSSRNKFTVISIAEILGLGCGLLVMIPLIHVWSGTGASIGVVVAVLSKWLYTMVYSIRKLGLCVRGLMKPYVDSYIWCYRHIIKRFSPAVTATD